MRRIKDWKVKAKWKVAAKFEVSRLGCDLHLALATFFTGLDAAMLLDAMRSWQAGDARTGLQLPVTNTALRVPKLL